MAIGAYAALRRDRAFDNASSAGTLILAGMPDFVIGTLLIVLFATNVFHVLPATVRIRPGEPPWSDWKGLVLPVATLTLAVVPYVARVMRASTIEVLESDYVEMARLKGIPERTVLWRHALPNAIGPTFQVIALNIAYLVGGVVLVETLFNYTGIGLALVDAAREANLPVVQFLAMLIAAIYVVTNLLADVGTILVTPRLRTRLPMTDVADRPLRRHVRRPQRGHPVAARPVAAGAATVADPHRPDPRRRARGVAFLGPLFAPYGETEFVGTPNAPRRRRDAARHRLLRPGRRLPVPVRRRHHPRARRPVHRARARCSASRSASSPPTAAAASTTS